ncbi:TPA: N-acetyl sugar amidotransferase [Candidatus Woesearchaeota archaeon]|nr:N-acetyl sugar amidotransferase [Candidatus Woesearchaeota archaeon]HII68551.1 N-acetyl sugar amidotransferase [Candidatus Woesearchaeota archaeon]
MTFCVRCCMPSTNEGEGFDEMGICKACCSSEEKMHINWVEREKELRKILFHYKEKAGDNYDCLVPISGGKDSCFQLHIIKRVYGLKPLAVTFSHSWYSEVGKWNLQNILEKLNVDHIMFTPNREVVNKIARHSLSMIGDTCWHCHAGVGAFPLQVAVKFKIPLLVWGESIAEQSGRTTYKDPAYERYDRDYFTRVSAKFYPDEMTNEELTMKDLFPFHAPTKEEVEKAGIVGIHLGDYIFWDAERQMEFVKKEYGWREWEDGEMDGTYKRYKSNECVMHGMHDFTKYLKRGFGRATDHASQDVRAGIITREEGFELIKKHDGRIPKSLNKYLDLAKMSREEFYDIMANHRNMVLNKKEVRSKRFEQNGPRAM